MEGAPLAAARAGYDDDFFAWAMEQAALLRSGRVSEADLENIAEEIESSGTSEKRELASRLKVVLLHLLKWQVQTEFRSRGWSNTIREQRRKLHRHLAENPSLRRTVPTEIVEAYVLARMLATAETGLPETAFPTDCLWSEHDVLDDVFLPS